MNISLTPKLEGYVKDKVATGLYNSASEVIREGLRLLEERDNIKQIQLASLKQDLEAGAKSLDAGQGRAFDKDYIKAQGKKLLAKH